jgi:uncharacterized OB-fold protein
MSTPAASGLRLHASFGDAFRGWLAQGELRVPRCRDCGETLAYSARVCRNGHANVEWNRAGGGATLVGLCVYRQTLSQAFAAPHAVAQVELDEGTRLVAAIDTAALPMRPGARLVVCAVDGRLVVVAG